MTRSFTHLAVLPFAIAAGLAFSHPLPAQSLPGPASAAQPPAATGIPSVQRNISTLHPAATYVTGGHPDWMALTPAATWVADSKADRVVALDPGSSRILATVAVAEPCSGLAADFGSLWVPSCREHVLVRIDLATHQVVGRIPATPADAEGGIATGGGSVWMPVKEGLARIDPSTNQVVSVVPVPEGSSAAAFAAGSVWITSTSHNLLTRVDAQSGIIIGAVPVGPQPRFLTVGAGSVWTLNQGDGTVTRVDTKTNRVVASIPVGTPGAGGEIAFGSGAVWTTFFGYPLTRIDPRHNRVTAQWTGPGGDSVRVAGHTLWLTNYKGGSVSRYHVPRR